NAVVTPVSASQIKVEVPAGATSGPLVVTSAQGCQGSMMFTVIDNVLAGCEGSSAMATDLFISQLTDSGTDSISYIEIFNQTGTAVNLSSYSLQFFNNGNSTQNGGNIALNSVSLPHNSTYVVAVGFNASN